MIIISEVSILWFPVWPVIDDDIWYNLSAPNNYTLNFHHQLTAHYLSN